MNRIYLDNAATSWPKPPGMLDAVVEFYERIGSPAARGSYREANDVQRRLQMARVAVAQVIGSHADEVVFTFNGTDSINTVLMGGLRTGDHVVSTAIEHNSVLRPLEYLTQCRGVEVSVARCDLAGRVDIDHLGSLIRPATRMVVVSHASNVTGAIQPLNEIADAAHAHDCRVLVDAAQTVGHIPIDVESIGCDYLAASGHKGLLGPLGTGVLYVNRDAQAELSSFRFGGTGSNSDQPWQPSTMPHKFESGNANVGGILGLAASIDFIESVGLQVIGEKSRCLTERLLRGFAAIEDVRLHGPAQSGNERVGVISITVGKLDSREVASMLDSGWGIQVRAGFHCAPLIHEILGTRENGGTVRFSPGHFNHVEELELVIEAIAEIAVTV